MKQEEKQWILKEGWFSGCHLFYEGNVYVLVRKETRQDQKEIYELSLYRMAARVENQTSYDFLLDGIEIMNFDDSYSISDTDKESLKERFLRDGVFEGKTFFLAEEKLLLLNGNPGFLDYDPELDKDVRQNTKTVVEWVKHS